MQHQDEFQKLSKRNQIQKVTNCLVISKVKKGQNYRQKSEQCLPWAGAAGKGNDCKTDGRTFWSYKKVLNL